MSEVREAEKLLRQWGVPPKVARVALDDPMQTVALGHAHQFITEWHEGTANICVLAGGVGVGKTVASAWAMIQIPQNEHSAWGVRRFRHISQICELGLYGDEDQRKERDTLKNARVLVLDDVGTEHMTDVFQTLFDGLINQRYEHDGATIITTNLTSDAFRERYGDRIYDRLRGRGAWFEINHDSLRGYQ